MHFPRDHPALNADGISPFSSHDCTERVVQVGIVTDQPLLLLQRGRAWRSWASLHVLHLLMDSCVGLNCPLVSACVIDVFGTLEYRTRYDHVIIIIIQYPY